MSAAVVLGQVLTDKLLQPVYLRRISKMQELPSRLGHGFLSRVQNHQGQPLLCRIVETDDRWLVELNWRIIRAMWPSIGNGWKNCCCAVSKRSAATVRT